MNALAFTVTIEELKRLRGVGTLAIALYFECLKTYVDVDGVVLVLAPTYNSMANALATLDSRGGGRRSAAPTVGQVRTALERLQAAGLVAIDREAGRTHRGLHITLLYPGRTSGT
jgi:hypothetical protein